MVSNVDLVRACRDKRLTADLFRDHGIRTPRLAPAPSPGDYPLIAKPYDGSSSIGVRVLRSESDLTPDLVADPKNIFCEYLEPREHDEYTVDMYYDRDSALKCLVPRLRIETRGGEVSKGRTSKLSPLLEVGDRLRELEGARGCITAQFFLNKATKELAGIEINPRFGGGFPLSYESGANFPAWLINEYLLNGHVDPFDDWTDHLTMLRYDAHVLVGRSAA